MKGVNLDVWSLANLQNFLTLMIQLESAGLTDTGTIRHRIGQNVKARRYPVIPGIKTVKKVNYALCPECNSILYGGRVNENGKKDRKGDYIIKACKKCRWSTMELKAK